MKMIKKKHRPRHPQLSHMTSPLAALKTPTSDYILHLGINDPVSANVATPPHSAIFRTPMRRCKDGLLWVILTILMTQSMSLPIIPEQTQGKGITTPRWLHC